jgi:RIO-like serine/threonine protein kinase
MKMVDILQSNKYSEVWRVGDHVYKRQHEFMTDNEAYFLKLMYPSGYVPMAVQVDRDLIRLEWLPNMPVTHVETFLAHFDPVLAALEKNGIKHGDLTEYAIRVVHNKPYLIDFAESRFWDDPRPPKRSEEDRWWLEQTMKKLSKGR